MNYFGLLLKLYKLKNNTKKTREEIQKLQNKQLRKILLYSYDHSKYYRKSFEKAGITRDKIYNFPISAFPTIDKKILMKNFEDLITVNDLTQEELRFFDESETIDKKILKNKYHIVHSSGSTGEARYFVYDNKAWETMLLAIIRAALWDMSMVEIIKLLMKTPRILYIAATDGRYGGRRWN